MKKEIFLKSGEKDILYPGNINFKYPGANITYFDNLISTQDIAKKAADTRANEGAVFISEKQSCGRGRYGRFWESPRGGLWFSMVLFPVIAPERYIQLSLVTALSICKTLERFLKLNPLIKWPNDIMLEGKKLAGILTETSLLSDSIKWAVVGIGLNVNNILPEEIENDAVSLSKILKKQLNRTNLFAEIMDEFLIDYESFKKHGFSYFKKEFQKRSCLINKKVRIEEAGKIIAGRVLEIDSEGFLSLETEKSIKQRILSGTVLSYE